MSAKHAGLGRGFDSLIPVDILDESFDPTASNEQSSDLRYIKRSDIFANPDQPRRHFDEEALEELASSIKIHGMVQPIVVTPKGSGTFQVVAGERRWRAAGIAELEKIPAIVRTLSEQHTLELALIENLQRKDLNPLETATAYLKLHTQFNMTYEQIGHRAGGKAVSTISNLLRLLQLPEDAKQAIVDRTITEGHARQILALENEPEAQKHLLECILREGWSVRKAEQYVVGYKKGAAADKQEQAVKHTQVETDFTKRLTKQLRLPVKHKTTAKGGQIIISYSSDKELSSLEKRLFNS